MKKNTLMIFAICIPFSVNTETLYTYVSVISSQIFLCLLAILFLFSLYLILQTTEARMYIKGILHLSLLVVLQYGFFSKNCIGPNHVQVGKLYLNLIKLNCKEE